MPAPAQDMYCDDDGVNARVGRLGVDLRTDDDPSSLEDCRGRASADIELSLRAKFPNADFTAVAWVYWCCVSFAARHLCRRRLNSCPDDLQAECEGYETQLADLAAGRLTLLTLPRAPGGVAVSNQHVQLGTYPGLGVDRRKSTDPRAPTRRRYNRATDLLPPSVGGSG